MKLHNFNDEELVLFSKLQGFYNTLRTLQSKSNEGETPCLGAGHCCRVGLMIPLLECANIAYNIIQQSYMIMESEGSDAGKLFMEEKITKLREAMFDETWNRGETLRLCAFYNEGCTIYPYRPAICRAYGTIVGVDDFCPRKRNVYGNVDVIGGKYVRNAVEGFQGIIEQYDAIAGIKVVIYMPLGVLKFLMSDDEMKKLSKETDQKFWQGLDEYNISFVEKYGREWKDGK